MNIWSWIKGKVSKRAVQETSVTTSIGDRSDGSYSTDQPIRSAEHDRFARAGFARRIAETVVARVDSSSLVLSLSGQWGDGKTSVLHMIDECLQAEDGVVLVRFNPWHFTTEEQLIRGFFGTLASALGKSLNTSGEKIGNFLKTYGGILSIASASLAGGAISLSPGEMAKDIGEALSTTTLDELKWRIEKGLSESGKRVVVLIDDIDRLDRVETYAIFKLVKLSAGFEYTTYLLAFDEEVVAASLGERYGEGGYAAGKAFLEKIIQVPLHLPPADTVVLRHLAYEGVDKALSQASIDLVQESVDAFTIQFVSGLEPRLETPRQARLYSNALMFSLPLVNGEVDVVDFMLIEGLRVFYPKLYRAIRDNPQLWLKYGDGGRQDRLNKIRLAVEASTPKIDVEERESLTQGLLKYLFPRVGDSHYDGEWDAVWAQAKRVCSSEYFHRYFSYGVPPNDLSDRAVDELIASAPSLEKEQLGAALLELLRVNPAVLIKKLRQREKKVSEAEAIGLLLALAQNGSQAPVERGPYVFGGTRMQMAVLVAQLLRRVPSGEVRNRIATEIARVAMPIPFAVECARWMMPGRDDPTDQHILTEDVLRNLDAVLVERVVKADEESPLYRQFGADARQIYWLWQKVEGSEVADRIRNDLARKEEEVDAFLDIFVGEGWSLETGLPSRSDFRRDAYDGIARLIDPGEIAGLLRDRYGAELDRPEFYHSGEVPLPLRFAHQFMVVHNKAVEEGRTSQS